MTSYDRIQLAREVAARLATEGAAGVLVIGSVARGVATEDSDLDLLAVARPTLTMPPFSRRIEHGVLVEVAAKTEAEWIEHLRGLRPRWLYALLDGGEVLVDDGAVRRLQSMAEEVLAAFVTPTEVRVENATLLWHARAKTRRALASDDDVACAYWAAMLLPTLLDGLLALHNRPCVPGARRLDVLAGVPLATGDEELLAEAVTATSRRRLEAARQLAASLEGRLGPVDLERVVW